jgi:ribosomal protein S19
VTTPDPPKRLHAVTDDDLRTRLKSILNFTVRNNMRKHPNSQAKLVVVRCNHLIKLSKAKVRTARRASQVLPTLLIATLPFIEVQITIYGTIVIVIVIVIVAVIQFELGALKST